MIALTLFVCLHAAPAECRRESVSFDGPLMACALFGQSLAAEWSVAHPKYKVRRYTCGVDGRQRAA